MKKIVLTLGAVLTFGIASAQTEPATVKTDKTETTVIAQEKQKSKVGAEKVKPNTTTVTAQPSEKEDAMQNPNPDKEHVKATPVTKTAADTVTSRRQVTKKAKRNK